MAGKLRTCSGISRRFRLYDSCMYIVLSYLPKCQEIELSFNARCKGYPAAAKAVEFAASFMCCGLESTNYVTKELHISARDVFELEISTISPLKTSKPVCVT